MPLSPVGTYPYFVKAYRFGGQTLAILFMVVMTLSIVVTNLLPIPGLDGACLWMKPTQSLVRRRYQQLEPHFNRFYYWLTVVCLASLILVTLVFVAYDIGLMCP